MIQEVIAEIITAEKKAEQLLSEANRTAREIGMNTQKEVESCRIACAQEIKDRRKSVLLKAEETATALAEEEAKASEQRAALVIRGSEKHVQRTVEWLADAFVKNNTKQ